MDISIELEEYKLNFRVAAIIRKDNQILLHHTIKNNHITLPGGRVQEGENTLEALQREIKEEMGEEIKLIKPVSYMENFFIINDQKYHELLVSYEVAFKNEKIYIKEKIEAIEKCKKDELEFIWLPINKLEENNFVPKGMIEIIKENKEFTLKINDERNQ